MAAELTGQSPDFVRCEAMRRWIWRRHTHFPPCDVLETCVFVKGVALLSYLFEETVGAFSSCHYALLLTLLRCACVPYLR